MYYMEIITLYMVYPQYHTIVFPQTSGDILGRAMVIHDFEGGRIACGIIKEARVAGADVEVSIGDPQMDGESMVNLWLIYG